MNLPVLAANDALFAVRKEWIRYAAPVSMGLLTVPSTRGVPSQTTAVFPGR